MTCNITNTPYLPDPLPQYSAGGGPPRHDVETSSIHSAAPSYTSAAPSYHSTVPPPGGLRPATSGRLPNPAFAPGFTPAYLRYDTNNSAYGGRAGIRPSLENYQIPSWSSVSSSHQAKHYHSVASRRATMASETEKAAALAAAAQSSMPKIQPPPDSAEDILEEDPYLVGSEAAAQARRQRLAAQRRGDEVLRQEDKAWDFLVKQMADWEERDRAWKRFRREVERPGFLRRRIGMIGRVT